MTTPDKSRSKGKVTKATKSTRRVKRKPPARSGPIRTGAELPHQHHDHHELHHHAETAGLSPHAQAEIDSDERKINKSVADTVRSANKVLADTMAQGRIAAEHFRHGDYNMRDVPVDVQIMGKRMIRLARELSETTLGICEQLLHQLTQIPAQPKPGQPSKVPPFPTGSPSNAAPPSGTSSSPPSSFGAPPPGPTEDGRTLALSVKFTGNKRAKALPSPLWKPHKPTLPEELHITHLQPMSGKAAPIKGVTFTVDVGGSLTAQVTVPPRQAAGIYAGVVTAASQKAPLGVLTIEILK